MEGRGPRCPKLFEIPRAAERKEKDGPAERKSRRERQEPQRERSRREERETARSEGEWRESEIQRPGSQRSLLSARHGGCRSGSLCTLRWRLPGRGRVGGHARPRQRCQRCQGCSTPTRQSWLGSASSAEAFAIPGTLLYYFRARPLASPMLRFIQNTSWLILAHGVRETERGGEEPAGQKAKADF